MCLLLLAAPAAAMAAQPAAVCAESVLMQKRQTAQLVGRQSPTPRRSPAEHEISALDEEGRVSLALASTSSRSNLSTRTLGSTDGTEVNGVCVDYTVEGYLMAFGPSRHRASPAYSAALVRRGTGGRTREG